MTEISSIGKLFNIQLCFPAQDSSFLKSLSSLTSICESVGRKTTGRYGNCIIICSPEIFPIFHQIIQSVAAEHSSYLVPIKEGSFSFSRSSIYACSDLLLLKLLKVKKKYKKFPYFKNNTITCLKIEKIIYIHKIICYCDS